jgi:excinuclease ABC subunit C
LRTELTSIPGIGPATARKLLQSFGSMAGVRRAGKDELRSVVGASRAEAVRRGLEEGS